MSKRFYFLVASVLATISVGMADRAVARDLTSRSETVAFIVGHTFHEFSNSRQADMYTTFTKNGRWAQRLVSNGKLVGNSRYLIRRDGKFCGRWAGKCWTVRTEGRNFRLVTKSGKVGKLFTRVK